jgi:N-acetylmuramoyl-L-alanine amidase
MDHRVKLVKEGDPNLLVSVHMNTFSDRVVLGAQVFNQKGSEKGRKLAQCIQEALNSGANEKMKREARSGDYYMLRETSCPGVIVECGFLSIAEDEKNLQDPEFQAKLADCIYKGVCAYLGLE